MKQKNTQIFFPNLDALRFFCFFSVFICHSFASSYESITSNDTYRFIKETLFGNGSLGVNFFFVLSGFLITYLLLVEKKEYGRVHVGKFYLRRILRIWPLFYFCIFFGFLAFPILKKMMGGIPEESANFFTYLLFINNFDYIRNGADSSVLSILWSVAIEEQFYLAWPLIIGFAKQRHLPFIFLFIVASSFIFRFVNFNNRSALDHHTISCISDMTVGGAGAYFAFSSNRFINWLRSFGKINLLIIYSGSIILYLFHDQIFVGNRFLIALDRLVISFFFLMVILEQNFCNRSLFKLKNLRNTSRLGQYTYGLYCLHMIGILITSVILAKFNWNRELWQVLIVEGFFSFVLTLWIAYISYNYFELWFLKLKNRFSFIKSEPLAVKSELPELLYKKI